MVEFRTCINFDLVVRELFLHSSSGQKTGFPSIVPAAHSELENLRFVAKLQTSTPMEMLNNRETYQNFIKGA